MTWIETAQRIERSVSAISVSLYEGVSMGYADALSRLGSMPRIEEYPSLIPMVGRAAMRNHWQDQGIGPGWSVGGNPSLSIQTLLVNQTEGIELRLLKERRRSYPGGVPIAGSNSSRQESWTNEPLAFELEGLSAPQIQKCLLLWDHHITEEGEIGIMVRVVHPLTPGTWGTAVPIDMNFEIDPAGTMFDTLSFRGDTQRDTFFPHITHEDNNEAASGQ